MDRLDPTTFPFEGVQVIEASAGTGKTWTIETFYLRLLLGEGCEPRLPPNILVVTFTNAATDELRRRIRERIAKTIIERRGLGTEAGEEAAVRLELALLWMDEAAIHTIHGWCSQVLKRFPLAGDALGPMQVQDTDELLLEVVRDWWRTFALDLPKPLQDALGKKRKTPDKLIDDLKKRLRTTDPVTVPLDSFMTAGWEPIREAFRAVRERLQEHRAAFEDCIRAGRESGDLIRMRDSDLQRWLTAVEGWCADVDGTDTKPLANAAKNLTGAGWAGRWAEGAAPHDHPFVQALAEATGLGERAAAARTALLLDHAAGWSLPRLEALKNRRGLAGSDDLVRKVAQALARPNGAALAERLHKRWPVAMVDEFQDTDRLQWDIFRRIYSGIPGVSLTLIGDPKQSIYGFRGADLDTYHAACTSAAKSWWLGTSYRSSHALVRALNHVFKHAELHGFQEVDSAGRSEDVFPALTVWHAEGTFSSDGFRGRMAQVCAQGVVERLRTGTPAREIAVLVRSWREAAAIRWALARRGVRSVYLSENDSVYATEEARHVLILLDACAHPLDDRRVRAAYALPLLGRSMDELARLTEDERELERLMGRFSDYHELWRRDGVLSLLYRVAWDHAILHDALDTRPLTNFLHLADLLQNEAATVEGEHALLRRLRECIDTAGDASGSDEHIVRLESDDDLVRVVTIHKAKGLEYPYVYLPFATAPVKEYDDDDIAESQRLLYVALTRARVAVSIGAVASTHSNQQATHRSLFGRLLNGGEMVTEETLPGQLTALAAGCEDIAVVPAPENDGGRWIPPVAEVEPRPARTFSGRQRERWWIGSYSALRLGPQRIETVESARQQVLLDAEEPGLPAPAPADPSIHLLRRGADTGNLLHGLLEWAAERGFATAAADDEARLAEVRRRARYLHDAPTVATLDRWLKAVLSTSYPTSTPFSLAGLQVYRSELEFFLGARRVDAQRIDDLITAHILPGMGRPGVEPGMLNGMLKGYVDLVFEHEGRWHVADFKSNALGLTDADYTLEAMADQLLKKRYDLQFTLYTLALHRLLRARLGDAYDYDLHMGEVIYLFLRGVHEPTRRGVFALKPPRVMIETLDALFEGREMADVA